MKQPNLADDLGSDMEPHWLDPDAWDSAGVAEEARGTLGVFKLFWVALALVATACTVVAVLR